MERNLSYQRENLSDIHAQNNSNLIQNPDVFAFLKADGEQSRFSSFFSKNGLCQDIIQVTDAEPDICLEVFYALYSALWPQINKQPDVVFKDTWRNFLGAHFIKGILCPPEKLIRARSIREIQRSFSQPGGEKQFFQELDQVVNSISQLKQKVIDYPDELLQRQEILASLDLVEAFYRDYRNKMTTLVLAMIEKEQVNASYMEEYHGLEDLLEPKAILMGDIFPNHWAFRISRGRAQKLLSLDLDGRKLGNYQSLPEMVAEPLVYFQANGKPGIRPENEFMLYSFYKHLQIPVPETALLILTNVFETDPEYFYAVQASEAVLGESSFNAYQNSETIFDHEAYVAQVIGALLTNPSDGSFESFQYSPKYQTFIRIDYDSIFEPELIEYAERKFVNVKSILYLLPQIDLPIPESIKTLFTTLDPQLTIFSWLYDLSKKNREYQALFTRLVFQKTRCIYQNLLPQDETPSLSSCLQQKVYVDPDIHGDSFYPKILVSRHMLETLREKLQIIEKTLLYNSSTSIQVLFEEISPALGKYYRKLRIKFNDPAEALDALREIHLNSEEIRSLSSNDKYLHEWTTPENLIQEFRKQLTSGQSPLDLFIRRQNSRKRKNVINLRVALKELQLLIQEGLTDSQSFSDIVDFRYRVSKMIDQDPNVIREIISLLSNLPHVEFHWLLTLEKYFLRVDCLAPKDLIPSSQAVFGVFMKSRTFLLTESENKFLFDRLGDVQKNGLGARRSNVTFFPKENPEFYLKQYPKWPGYEVASTLFMRLLGIKQLPYQDFLIINHYPILLTQKISGHTVHGVWQSPEAVSRLDPFHTGLLIISAMLLNPGDGHANNFILSQDGRYLIPVDHENWFLPSFSRKETTFWNPETVNASFQTQTLLFCLNEMKMPIPSEVKHRILSIDFDKLLMSWLAELDKLETRFSNFLDQNQREEFLKQGTVLRIPFYKQFLHNIHWKAHKIKKILEKGSQLTPFSLLRAVEPFIAKCYEDSFRLNHNLRDRFISTTKELYKHKGIYGSKMRPLDPHTMVEIINISEENLLSDPVNQRIGPVDALELLKQLIQERPDRAKEKLLCELDGRKPSGLEASLNNFFRNSQTGLAVDGSKLITSSKLSDLFAQAPSKGVQIRFLSLPESPLFTEKEIKILAKECPNLEYLNVSGCEKLRKIVTERGEWPLLVRLEALKCLNLEKFVSNSPLRVLRIESQHEINIFIERSPVDFLLISKKINQFELLLQEGESFEIKSLNHTISNNDFLLNLIREEENTQEYLNNIHVTIGKNSISSGNDLAALIKDINLQNSNLQAEDIKKMIMLKLPNLKRLELPRNKMKGKDCFEYFIQGVWPRLNYLDLSANEIHDEGIEVLVRGNWPELEFVNLQETKITAAGVETLAKKAKWTQLKSFHLSENKINDKALAALYQGNWPLLQTLSLKNTGVTKRALFNFLLNSNFPNLKEIDLGRSGKNLVNNLLQKNWSELEELDLSDCGIKQNEVEIMVNKRAWSNLKHLNLSDNDINDGGLEILAQGKWPLLETLNLKKTNRSTIGVRAIVNQAKWAKIKHLNLSHNEINDEGFQMLAQGDWPLLQTLNLENTTRTKKGLLYLISNPKWANLEEINFGWNEENTAKNLIQKNWHLLEGLDLSDSRITQNEIELIVSKCNWSQLKHINLSCNPEITDEALAVLCQGNWPLLESLNLENTGVTKKALLNFLLHTNWPNFKTLLLPKWWKDDDTELASHFIQKDLSQVKKLELNNLKIDFTKIEAILSRNKCLELKYLNLSENEISQEGKKSLLGVTECPLLEELYLRNIQLTSNEIDTILNKSNWHHLKNLDLSHNQFFDEGLPALVLAEWPFLEYLDLSKTNLSLQGVGAILDLSKWGQLKHLDVSQNELFDEGLSTLALVHWPALESLNLSQIKCSSKGIETFVSQSKWSQLKHLNISNNELFDEGISALTLAGWPLLEELNVKNTKITQKGLEVLVSQMKLQNLKKLDISENIIGNEGLKMLASADFEHLVYCDTQTTRKGHIALLENMKWPNLHHLEHSLNESFYNYDESILAAVAMCYKKQSLMVMVLAINWLGSKEIYLTIKHQDLSEKVIILPRNKLNQLETINISFDALPKIKSLQSIVLPSNLKILDLSKNSLSDQSNLENFVFKDCPLVEDLRLQKTNITTKGIRILFSKINLLNLKNLDFSQNIIQNEGLEILASASWKFLENLDLEKTGITNESIKIIVSKSNWPNLKKLNISRNKIQDKGLEMLCSGKWPLLESLNLQRLDFTEKGIESIINKSEWPNLKNLDLSFNKNILDEGSESLASGKWPLLEFLSLNSTNVELKVLETLVKKASWPNLKEISLMDNIGISAHHQDAIKGLVFRKWPHVKLTI